MDTGRAGRGVYRIPTYRHGRTALRPQRLNAHRPIRNTDLGRRGRGATGPDTAEAATGVRRWWRRSGGCKSSAWRTRHRWAVRVVVTRVRAALCVDRALSEPLSVQPRGAGASGPQPARNGTRRPNGQMRLGEWRVRRVVVASRSGSGRYDKCGGAPVTCRVRESTVAVDRCGVCAPDLRGAERLSGSPHRRRRWEAKVDDVAEELFRIRIPCFTHTPHPCVVIPAPRPRTCTSTST